MFSLESVDDVFRGGLCLMKTFGILLHEVAGRVFDGESIAVCLKVLPRPGWLGGWLGRGVGDILKTYFAAKR